MSSQASSVSSCDDYIILPDCFDTSRPLSESVHGSATALEEVEEVEEEEEEGEDPTLAAQRGREEAEEPAEEAWPPAAPRVTQLCTSQTPDTVTLPPEAVPATPLLSPPALYSPRLAPLLPPAPPPRSPTDPFLVSRSEALYLAEDPGPSSCDPYDPRPPRVHLNGMCDIDQFPTCATLSLP